MALNFFTCIIVFVILRVLYGTLHLSGTRLLSGRATRKFKHCIICIQVYTYTGVECLNNSVIIIYDGIFHLIRIL
jgi:hypothetical protein